MHDPIRLNYKLSPDFIVVRVICKNEVYSIKNEGATVFTILYIDFSDAHGQLTPWSVWDLAEIQTHPSFYACPSYLQE